MTQRALGYLLWEFRTNSCRDLTDGDLLERFCATREEAAFGLLVQRHGPMVFAVCRRILRNLHDAEDAFQATFLVLVRKARSIRNKASLASWLHGVARRVASRARAQASARQRHEKHVQGPACGEPVDALIEQELRLLLDEEIGRLPERYRAAVVLCWLERKTFEQAAGELGWPKSSLAGRLDRARRMLQERLTRRGLSIQGGLAGTLLTAEAAPAEVPAFLALEVARAATLTLAGTTGAAAVMSPHVAGLAEGVITALSAAKLKMVLLLSVLVALMGSAAIAHFATWGKPAVRAEHAQVKTPPVRSPTPNSGEPDRDRGQGTANDLYGDPLPAGAIARLGTERYRGVPGSWPSAFDAEGKTFVGGSDRGVTLSDIQTGRVLRRFTTPGRVYAAAISPDGRTVAAGGGPTDDVIRIWDATTGRALRQIKSSVGSYGQILLFTPDGKKLARDAGNGATSLWDLVTGKEIWKRGRADEKSSPFSPQAFSPDGEVLIGTEKRGREDALVFVETASGQELRRVMGISSRSDLAFSRDRKLIAVHGQGWVLQLWDIAAGKKLRDIPGLRSTGEHFAFSPDGQILALSSEDKSIRLLDVATGKEVRRVAKGLGTAERLLFLHDNKTLAFRLWNESSVRVWDLERDRELYPLGGHRGRMYAALYSPDGRTIVSASMDNTIRFWDLANGQELHCTEAHSGGVWCLAMTADGNTLASASLNDHAIRLWSTAGRKERARLALQEGAQALAFSPDGKNLLTASPGPNGGSPDERSYVVRLWDIAAGKELRHWHTRSAHCPIALSADGRFVASENAGSILVWNSHTGRQQRELPLPTSPSRVVSINDLGFSPDGRTLVSAKKDGSYKSPQSAIRFWELATGKERLSVKLAPGYGNVLSFSPEGQYLAVGGDDQKVHLMDTSTGEIIRQLEGHHGEITSVAFAPDGKSLATGSTDTTILIWKVDDLPGHHRKPSPGLSPGELDALWNDLAGVDAAKAYRAIATMAAAPGTVAYMAQRLRPIAPADPALLTKLVAELDSQQFTVREKAAVELAKLGDLAEPALRNALTTGPSLEFQRRAEVLLRKLEEPVASPEMLRSLRALEVLERIDKRETGELLMTVASGTASSRITQGAQAALRRQAR